MTRKKKKKKKKKKKGTNISTIFILIHVINSPVYLHDLQVPNILVPHSNGSSRLFIVVLF